MEGMDLMDDQIRPRVFIVQESPGKNLIPAKQFGDFELLMENCFYQIGLETKEQNKGIVKKFYERLRSYNDNDFILPIGDIALIALACTIAADINGGRYKMLKWDRQNTCYYPISIDIY